MIKYAEKKELEALSRLDRHVSADELERAVADRRVITAKENGCVIGWLRFGLFWDKIPFMNMLYVIEPERGKGFGTKLCEFWENEMRRDGVSLVLTSTLSSERAQFFYRKRGYKDCGSLMLPEEPLEVFFLKELKQE